MIGCAVLLGRVERVLQLISPAAQAAEGSQRGTELGADGFFDHVVAAGSGGPQALLGEHCHACLPGSVICKDDTAVGCRLGKDARRIEAAARPLEPGVSVRLGTWTRSM